MPNSETATSGNDVFEDIDNAFNNAQDTQQRREAGDRERQAIAEVQVTEDAERMTAGTPMPPFIDTLINDWTAGLSHVFIVNGNITDYPDNSGTGGSMEMLLSQVFDTKWLTARLQEQNGGTLPPGFQRPKMDGILAYYTTNNGLVFPCPESKQLWQSMMRDHYSDSMDRDMLEAILSPSPDINEVMRTLNYTFEASKATLVYNRGRRGRVKTEHKFTVAFFNANFLFPNGQIAMLQGDRSPISYIYNWAQDDLLGNRNRIILLSPGIDDIHETIRGGDSGVRGVVIKRPTLEQREQWLINYETLLKNTPEAKRPAVGGKRRGEVLYSDELKDDPDVTPQHMMAVQTAGLNLKQLEQVVRQSWRSNSAIDLLSIRQHKQRVIEDAFGGLVDFIEPERGFEVIGGHDNLIAYAEDLVIGPLRRGDRRTCSKGFIMSGPPGTGKTVLATAIAKESKMNFLVAHLDKVFGGIVGETESKTRKLLAAIDSSAPCIVFMDEIDSVLSSGRSSPGDSGTSGRVFNSIMTFLSDESRAGRVCVIAATNRPDLLDKALIRAGRFDAILPALPPNPQADNCAKARSEILKALGKKHRVKLDKSLASTLKSTTEGLGRLFNDSRVWTGAEIEVVLKKAMLRCFREKRQSIIQADWDRAMDAVIPNTGDVELQINLALLYVNDLEYCPKEWLERARNKGELKSQIQTTMAEGGLDRE